MYVPNTKYSSPVVSSVWRGHGIDLYDTIVHRIFMVCLIQGWFQICVHPMRDVVTYYRRLSLAGLRSRVSPVIVMGLFWLILWIYLSDILHNHLQTNDKKLSPRFWIACIISISRRRIVSPQIITQIIHAGCNCHVRRSLTLQRRHNGRDGVSNPRRLDCLCSRLFRGRSTKSSKPRVIGLC